jgi:hypothetical protein
MAQERGKAGLRKFSSVLVLFALGGVACAGSPRSVVRVGARTLQCQKSEPMATLNRSTPMVREYLVGCDFMFTRVYCTEVGCYPAEVKPPCIGDKPCFEEDPMTLEWRLPPGARARVVRR